MGPKLDPNRIFDAEALRKPLGGLLERSWTLLEPKKTNLEPLLGCLGALLDAYKPLFEEPVLAWEREARPWKCCWLAWDVQEVLLPMLGMQVNTV